MLDPIGVDLDNTIVSYEKVLWEVVHDFCLPIETASGKNAIRNAVRCLPQGEIIWQKLQAEIYGPRMNKARLIEGVMPFFKKCRRHSLDLYIVSHKTKFANYDNTNTNLHDVSWRWLKAQGFFDHDKAGLGQDRVFFEATRQDKIKRIASLGCCLFIDDLEETYLEKEFPKNVVRILYDPYQLYQPRRGVTLCHDWNEISRRIEELFSV